MRFFDALRLRLRALLRSDAVDRDLGDEIREHLERLVDENIARGMTPDAARVAAQREFGPVTQIVEESRDARGVMWVTNAWNDLKYGMRLMRRSPGFVVAAILTIALGIGATTAMFSVVYGVLLQPLPYGEPERLVNIWTTAPKRGLPRAYVGMANVYDYRARNHVFEEIAALRAVANFNLIGEGEPERLFAARVSANLFPVLRVSPLLGRTFTEEEDEIGHEQRRNPQLRALAASLRRGPDRRRPNDLAERRAAHGRRRHAGRLRVSDSRVSDLHAAHLRSPGTRQSLELLVPRSGAAEAGRHTRAGARGDGHHRRANRAGASERGRRHGRRGGADARRHGRAPSARRSTCCLALSSSCCSSAARISRTCCWRGRSYGSASWRFARRWAPVAAAW